MRATQSVVAALVGVLLAGGCSEDPEPRIATRTTTMPTTVAPQSEPSKTESAEQFLGRWFRAGSDMQNSGNTAPFLALSVGCEPCEKLASTVTEVYQSGGFIRTDDAKITSTRELGTSGELREYVVVVETPPTEIMRSDSGEREQLPGGINTYRFSMYSTDEGLRIENFLLRSPT